MQGVRVVIVAVKPVKADGAKDGREKRSRKGETMEEEPAEVPGTGMQAGEVRARWAWTEPCVWTDRMLEALENGVKGGVMKSTMSLSGCSRPNAPDGHIFSP